MAAIVHELHLTEAAVEKLGARDISEREVRQLLRNAHVTVHNPSAEGNAERRLLIGRTDGGRILTLVVEETMAKDPWTDPDPQPGDFDDFLKSVDRRDPCYVQVHEGNSDARVRLIVSVDGEDAARLGELAAERGQGIDEVVAELVRNA